MNKAIERSEYIVYGGQRVYGQIRMVQAEPVGTTSSELVTKIRAARYWGVPVTTLNFMTVNEVIDWAHEQFLAQ